MCTFVVYSRATSPIECFVYCRNARRLWLVRAVVARSVRRSVSTGLLGVCVVGELPLCTRHGVPLFVDGCGDGGLGGAVGPIASFAHVDCGSDSTC